VLKVPKVGASDNFLKLGGDSLLAAKVAVHVRKQYEIEFPIRALFEANLSELAQLIDVACSARAETTDSDQPRLTGSV
jgi:acyl carrier protein